MVDQYRACLKDYNSAKPGAALGWGSWLVLPADPGCLGWGQPPLQVVFVATNRGKSCSGSAFLGGSARCSSNGWSSLLSLLVAGVVVLTWQTWFEARSDLQPEVVLAAVCLPLVFCRHAAASVQLHLCTPVLEARCPDVCPQGRALPSRTLATAGRREPLGEEFSPLLCSTVGGCELGVLFSAPAPVLPLPPRELSLL